ncbi:MAG TPA: ABC transporter substrate-binding protein [Solirubrobacteraceae bacterium]|nr:ABC transporter substrate-binding protein [Solirubrobacteraceae bacterium]
MRAAVLVVAFPAGPVRLIEFRVLGSFEVVDDGGSVALGGPKQRALLAVLLLHRGEAVSTDRLIDEIWGERPPASANKLVQGYVSNLRKVLGDGLLVTQGHGYLLVTGSGRTDVDRFDALVGRGREALERGDALTAAAVLREALGVWRGPPLADFAYEPFAQAEIARLEEARLAALEDRIDADLASGEHARLVGELEALVREHPARERLRGQLMLALYRSGRQADALEAYREGRGWLRDELGLEPGHQLRDLERAILAQDPALDLRGADRPAALRRVVARRRRGGILIAGGAAVLLCAIALVAMELPSSATVAVLAPPNSLAAIDTGSNRVTAVVPVGTRPGPIAYGAGSLWIGNLDDETVSRVDPATLQMLRTIPMGDPPTAVAFAGRRAWVVDSDPTATFVTATSIDPQFDAIGGTVRIGNVVPGTAAAAVSQGDTLWVAPFSGELTRLDGGTGAVMQQTDPNSAPAGIAIGAGAIWTTDSEADTVTRVDPTGLVAAYPVGHDPTGIAVGDGAVWVADMGDDAVVRVDPSTYAVTNTIPVGDAPSGVTFGAGSVWVANSGDGTVTRIDPGANRAVATIRVGGSPQAVIVAAGRVWVTIDAPTIPPTASAAPGGTLKADAADDVDYMDPALAYYYLSWELLYATCAKLLNYPDKSGLAGSQLVPEVAQSLPTISDGGRTYTFKIRSGFRFSPPSDAPVTAQTFKYTIERSLNPATVNKSGAPLVPEFDDIVGARAYMTGKAADIAGVIARGDTLTIRLVAPEPDLPTLLAQPFFCAVPTDTPINPQGVRVIPSAGPYDVASYTPGQGVVLTRNPNYHGSRPHRLARIELQVNIPGARAVAQVQGGTADYAVDGEVDSSDAATLAARYGPDSPAARQGHQQYFVDPLPQLSAYALNTHRPLFANVRLRQAVNYAVNRTALARLGDDPSMLPAPPTDHYLPPGIPGYQDVHVYPLTPDLAKARQLARGHTGATAVLYTCDVTPCPQQAQIITADLAAIGIHVETKTFSVTTLYTKYTTPGEPFDIGYFDWSADYPDPYDFLNLLLEDGTEVPTLQDQAVRRELAAAAQLAGPRRYLTYGKLDLEIARDAAPLIAYANPPEHEFFSARVGCQTYAFYGLDLAALCLRRNER